MGKEVTAVPTKHQVKEFLKHKLGTDKDWARRALVRIYSCQTEEEQQAETNYVYNGVGFTGFDAEILSSFAKQLAEHNRLSRKQDKVLLKRMPKYWKQIYNMRTEEINRHMAENNLISGGK